jgi:hypothetical protein
MAAAAAVRRPHSPPAGARRPWALLALLLLLVAEVVLLPALALQRPLPRLAHFALAADAVGLTLLAVWLGGGPRALGLTGGRVARAAGVGLLLFAAGLRVAGVEGGGLLLALGVAAEATLALVVGLAVARAAREGGDGWARAERALEGLLPRAAVGALLAELRVGAALLSALAGRPVRRPAPSLRVFPPMEASDSGWFVPVVAFASLVEAGALHALLLGLKVGAGWVHATVVAVHGYSLLWLVAERRLMQASAHRLEADALVLSLGLRFEARVPYALVARALPLRTEAERRSVQARRGEPRNARVTPLDAPNVHLCLREPLGYATFFGLRRRAQHLDLFVDRPETFLAELAARLPPPPAPAPPGA